jgi:hypothetical protein
MLRDWRPLLGWRAMNKTVRADRRFDDAFVAQYVGVAPALAVLP